MSPAGRPEIGQPVNIRLGDELLAKVDAYAAKKGTSRAEAIRQMVRENTMLRRSDELDALPTFAVVEDRSNQVWQKLPLTLNQVRNNPSRSYGWFKPGDATVYVTDHVGTPARLLDDGR